MKLYFFLLFDHLVAIASPSSNLMTSDTKLVYQEAANRKIVVEKEKMDGQ